MKTPDVTKTNARYDERLKVHGETPEALGWTKGRHNLRFKVLCDYWMKDQRLSILDFGCGFGDLYKYLADQKIAWDYEGVDINPNLVEVARRRHPEAVFHCGNILETGLSKDYDLILCSGTFNTLVQDNGEFVKKAFDLFAKHSRIGFASNFLSNKVDRKTEYAFHYDPAQVLNLAYDHSRRISFRNDYMPFEFSVFVDRRMKFDPARSTYPEFESYLVSTVNGEHGAAEG